MPAPGGAGVPAYGGGAGVPAYGGGGGVPPDGDAGDGTPARAARAAPRSVTPEPPEPARAAAAARPGRPAAGTPNRRSCAARPGLGGAACGWSSCGASIVRGSELPPGISSVLASVRDGGGSSASSAPMIGGANTVAGTATDCPWPESLTVFPAQLPPPESCRWTGRGTGGGPPVVDPGPARARAAPAAGRGSGAGAEPDADRALAAGRLAAAGRR